MLGAQAARVEAAEKKALNPQESPEDGRAADRRERLLELVIRGDHAGTMSPEGVVATAATYEKFVIGGGNG